MTERTTWRFFDDEHIAETVRLQRVVEQPKKFGPVIEADKPWESHCVIVFGSVLPHPSGAGFQAWYQTFLRSEHGPITYYCYAESDDGVHWRKPELGLYEYAGSTANNIIMPFPDYKAESLSVVIEPGDDPDRRYKLLHYATGAPGGNGLFAWFSPDGIHWTVREEPVLLDTGDRTAMMLNEGPGPRYVAYCRHGNMMEEFRSGSSTAA